MYLIQKCMDAFKYPSLSRYPLHWLVPWKNEILQTTPLVLFENANPIPRACVYLSMDSYCCRKAAHNGLIPQVTSGESAQRASLGPEMPRAP